MFKSLRRFTVIFCLVWGFLNPVLCLAEDSPVPHYGLLSRHNGVVSIVPSVGINVHHLIFVKHIARTVPITDDPMFNEHLISKNISSKNTNSQNRVFRAVGPFSRSISRDFGGCDVHLIGNNAIGLDILKPTRGFCSDRSIKISVNRQSNRHRYIGGRRLSIIGDGQAEGGAAVPISSYLHFSQRQICLSDLLPNISLNSHRLSGDFVRGYGRIDLISDNLNLFIGLPRLFCGIILHERQRISHRVCLIMGGLTSCLRRSGSFFCSAMKADSGLGKPNSSGSQYNREKQIENGGICQRVVPTSWALAYFFGIISFALGNSVTMAALMLVEDRNRKRALCWVGFATVAFGFIIAAASSIAFMHCELR